MTKNIRLLILASALLAINFSCGDGKPATSVSTSDSLSVVNGEKVFATNCSSCHNFRSDGIGPQLGGVTASVSDDWIVRFIRDPQAVINSGDTVATSLLKKFHAVMPSFASLPDSQVMDVVHFLHTRKARVMAARLDGLREVVDPIPDSITTGPVVVALQPVVKMPPSSSERPFTRINKIAMARGVPYVMDMRGIIYSLVGNQPEIYLNLAKAQPHFEEKPGLGTGLGSFAFHPEFARNGIFYTTHTDSARTARADFAIADSIKTEVQWVLTEWTASDPSAKHFNGSHRELLRIDMVTGMHGAQEISFNPGAKPGDEDYGLLYAGVGDGGAVEAGYSYLVHQPSKVWGSVLRIDPRGKNSANGKYGIPSGNPFVSDASKLHEIYAYGFRNPNRISWTRNGSMLVSNIGQANIESVNVVTKGLDFGWPLREGPFVLDYDGDMKKIYALPSNDSANHFSYPGLQFDHDEGSAISGGFEYTGVNAKRLAGKYIFGDIVSGKIFYADVAKIRNGHPPVVHKLTLMYNGKVARLRDLCGDNRVDLRFAKNDRGEIYILTKSDGMIYQLKDP